MTKFKAIISYPEMVRRENASLQRGMNFRLNPSYSVLLMSVRKGAPYNDRWHEDTGLLEYEGHDVNRQAGVDPKAVDQPMHHRGGSLTENGKFHRAALAHKIEGRPPEVVQVYEKISQGVWSDRGRYELVDAVITTDRGRKVFRFFLRPVEEKGSAEPILRHTRVIPTRVKVEVWKRDQGHCVICGSTKNLHFDHDIPYSKGGSSITPENVRLLCAKHNLQKSDKIMGWMPWLVGATMFVAKTA